MCPPPSVAVGSRVRSGVSSNYGIARATKMCGTPTAHTRSATSSASGKREVGQANWDTTCASPRRGTSTVRSKSKKGWASQRTWPGRLLRVASRVERSCAKRNFLLGKCQIQLGTCSTRHGRNLWWSRTDARPQSESRRGCKSFSRNSAKSFPFHITPYGSSCRSSHRRH